MINVYYNTQTTIKQGENIKMKTITLENGKEVQISDESYQALADSIKPKVEYYDDSLKSWLEDDNNDIIDTEEFQRIYLQGDLFDNDNYKYYGGVDDCFHRYLRRVRK